MEKSEARVDVGELVEGREERANVVGESAGSGVWEGFAEKTKERIDGDDEDSARGRAALDDACQYVVEEFGAVPKVSEAPVFVVEGPKIVEKSGGDPDDFQNDEDEGVGQRGEGGTEIKEEKQRGEVDGVRGVAGGEKVKQTSPRVESDGVGDTLAPWDVGVLLVISPVLDLGGDLLNKLSS